MYLPSFRHLIEIEALKNQNQIDLSAVQSEENRICDLEQLRNTRNSQINALNAELKSLNLIEKQLEIESLELKLRKTILQMETLSNEKEIGAMEHQLSALAQELSGKEEKYFQLLERSEAIDHEREEAAQFIAGSALTLVEISHEVEAQKQKLQKQIDERFLRIHSLEEQMDKALLKFYLDLEKKFSPKKAVAFLVDKKCTSCFVQVDSMFKSALEEGRSIETCPNCGRLLIPETSKIF